MGVGFRGNICNSSLASWKARSRLPKGHNCTFLLALRAEALIRQNRPLLKGWVTLGLNIWVKGYVYRQHLYGTPLDKKMDLLQLCHWKFSHLETL